MLRIMLILAFATSAACAKKQAAPKAPESAVPAAPGAAGEAPDEGANADESKAPDDLKGDPCDGGESK